MAPLDALGPPDIAHDAPAGANLEFDADFVALDRAAQGKPEQQYGTTIIAAEPPDWRQVAADAQTLAARSHDLRILAHLGVAKLHSEGFVAYASVLGAVRALLETRWAEVHPHLDPEDDNDPTLRANALLRLADPARVLRPLRDVPLAVSARAGTVSWRDIAVLNGLQDPEPGREKPTEPTIRAAFQDTAPERLAALRDALAQGLDDVAAIPRAFDERAGYGTGPGLDDLAKQLREMLRDVDRYRPSVADAGPVADAPAEEAPMVQANERASGGAASVTHVATRADALRLLDLVIAYYRRYEPSSPLPLLIERARRLADMEFIDILRDLAPDGVTQAQHIVGTRE